MGMKCFYLPSAFGHFFFTGCLSKIFIGFVYFVLFCVGFFFLATTHNYSLCLSLCLYSGYLEGFLYDLVIDTPKTYHPQGIISFLQWCLWFQFSVYICWSNKRERPGNQGHCPIGWRVVEESSSCSVQYRTMATIHFLLLTTVGA